MARVLYLAEVQKQNKGFMGGIETKLRLLACQRNDQSWSIVPGNESITTEEANDFGDGALVVVGLGVNRQMQGKPESASKRVVGVLQGFSRLLEKTKNQEQEIDQWKESLTIQSEELSKREIEMETRLEQLEQMEEEFKQLESQRSELLAAKAEAEKLRNEFENKNQELAGAWKQLRGEQNSLQEQLKDSKVLDEHQASKIQENLNFLSSATASNRSLKEQLEITLAAVKEQQQILAPHGQQLEQNQQAIQQKQRELENCQAQLEAHQQELDSINHSLVENQKQLQLQQQSLIVKQEFKTWLSEQEHSHHQVLQMLTGFGFESSEGTIESKLDLPALENMPLGDLETKVANLQTDLEKIARFVSDQEEELTWQCQAVDELEVKIKEASEFERLTLEQELADEKEAKKMLDKTLVGQRRSLRERHEILLLHSRILKRRQGVIELDADSDAIDLEPIKQNLQSQIAAIGAQQQQLKQEIDELEQKIQQIQTQLKQKTTVQQELQLKLQKQQDLWHNLNVTLTELKLKTDFGTQQLQPLQNSWDIVSQQLGTIEMLIASQVEKNLDGAVAEIDVIIKELMC